MTIPKCFNKRCYINDRTEEQTTNATTALQWHNQGDKVRFYIGYDSLNDAPMYHPSIIEGKRQEPKPDKNRLHCKSIADDIDDYCGGRVFKCPECGETITIPDDREKHLCKCGYIDDIDEFEQLSIYDYLEDVLDIEYRIGSDRQLRSVQIMVACGGPNIYIDTASQKVELYWWGDSAYYPLSSDAVASIDEWAEELYQC